MSGLTLSEKQVILAFWNITKTSLRFVNIDKRHFCHTYVPDLYIAFIITTLYKIQNFKIQYTKIYMYEYKSSSLQSLALKTQS